jgi:hypothetical protein
VKKIVTGPNGEVSYLQSTTFYRKRITCILKGSRSYALVESLNRLFFPKCPLAQFMAILAKFNLDINELSVEEEQAFIKHYELRIKKLRCSKIVNMEELDSKMEDLMRKLLPQEASPDEHQAACQAIKNYVSSKRSIDDTGPAPVALPPKKTTSSKLENIMNKLKARIDTEESENNNSSKEGGASESESSATNEAPSSTVKEPEESCTAPASPHEGPSDVADAMTHILNQVEAM